MESSLALQVIIPLDTKNIYISTVLTTPLQNLILSQLVNEHVVESIKISALTVT